jgi:hypothetical protein
MSVLDRLAGLSQGTAPVLRARTPSRFEPSRGERAPHEPLERAVEVVAEDPSEAGGPTAVPVGTETALSDAPAPDGPIAATPSMDDGTDRADPDRPEDRQRATRPVAPRERIVEVHHHHHQVTAEATSAPPHPSQDEPGPRPRSPIPAEAPSTPTAPSPASDVPGPAPSAIVRATARQVESARPADEREPRSESAPRPADRRPDRSPPAPVTVTIGRIDIRAMRPPSAPAASPPTRRTERPRPGPDLVAYLEGRR